MMTGARARLAFKPLRAAWRRFSAGCLKRNVLDLYTFLCRNYEPGRQIYAFGFSRGAFTIRVVLASLANQGLVPPLRFPAGRG
jgi:uncharacterized protein (DUF2235 family)